jgi:DNA-binding MarR family transcriptional regulator
VRAESADPIFSWPQLAILRRLDSDGPATTAELARAERVTPQSMGALVAELEAGGYVARTDDVADGRRRLVSLTASGRQAHAAGRAARGSWLARRIDSRLNAEEQRALLDALALLRRIAEP